MSAVDKSITLTIGRCPKCGWHDDVLDVCWGDGCKDATRLEPIEVVPVDEIEGQNYRKGYERQKARLERALDALAKQLLHTTAEDVEEARAVLSENGRELP